MHRRPLANASRDGMRDQRPTFASSSDFAPRHDSNTTRSSQSSRSFRPRDADDYRAGVPRRPRAGSPSHPGNGSGRAGRTAQAHVVRSLDRQEDTRSRSRSPASPPSRAHFRDTPRKSATGAPVPSQPPRASDAFSTPFAPTRPVRQSGWMNPPGPDSSNRSMDFDESTYNRPIDLLPESDDEIAGDSFREDNARNRHTFSPTPPLLHRPDSPQHGGQNSPELIRPTVQPGMIERFANARDMSIQMHAAGQAPIQALQQQASVGMATGPRIGPHPGAIPASVLEELAIRTAFNVVAPASTDEYSQADQARDRKTLADSQPCARCGTWFTNAESVSELECLMHPRPIITGALHLCCGQPSTYSLSSDAFRLRTSSFLNVSRRYALGCQPVDHVVAEEVITFPIPENLPADYEWDQGHTQLLHRLRVPPDMRDQVAARIGLDGCIRKVVYTVEHWLK